jgi:hypothetical protein
MCYFMNKTVSLDKSRGCDMDVGLCTNYGFIYIFTLYAKSWIFPRRSQSKIKFPSSSLGFSRISAQAEPVKTMSISFLTSFTEERSAIKNIYS